MRAGCAGPLPLLGDDAVALGELEAGEDLGRLADGEVAHIGDVVAVDQHRERDRVEPLALTGGAGDLAHVALDLLPLAVRLGLRVAPGEVRDHALVVGVVGAGAAVAVLVGDGDLGDALAVEQGVGLLLGELRPRRARCDVEVVGHRLDEPGEVGGPAAGPRGDGPVLHRQIWVGHHELRIDLEAGAEPVAGRARAVGLNEKLRGARSWKLMPHVGQAKCWLNVSVSSGAGSRSRGTIWISATPSASASAVSRESVNRRAMSDLATRRSTTTWMVCIS